MPLPEKYNFSGTPEQLAILLPIAQMLHQSFEDLELSSSGHDYERIPGTSFRGSPQVQLWFKEQSSVAKLADRARNPHEARASFRLPEGSWASEAPAREMARKIKAKFATPIFQFQSGEIKFTYFDNKKGYDFRLLTLNATEAKKVIESVMDLNGHSPDWKLLKKHESEPGTFSSIPDRVQVLGKTVKVSNLRPKTTLYFNYAIGKVPPRIEEVYLVDTGRLLRKAYENAPNSFLLPASRIGEQHNPAQRLA
jgi:hypothetical protein